MNTNTLSGQLMFDLSGKTAVVTGAAAGIGAASAKALASAGAAVCCADIDMQKLEQIVSEIREAGGTAVATRCNVADEVSVATLIACAEKKHGPLDVMVNNAGTLDSQATMGHEADTADWKRVLSVNLDGVFFGSREALKVMYPRKSGRIINIASAFGLVGTSSVAPLTCYPASKGAVVNLTRELSLQYARHGININAICPGPVHTGLAGVYEIKDLYDRFVECTPMGRVATTDEIKGTIVYLASPASSFVTGIALPVDGGWTAQ
ncbi:SDR family NAD(P)-dependent oxidoreductase [Paraburkholderia caribensis]|uniref:SDR family NAD(P)-dependent oxidoreductase n=1 Tax=Paraburkholderia caribensis TaxID=75105 RepID=UPI0034D38508